MNGLELIIDGGVRQKKQQAFSEIAGFATTDRRELTTYSFTPRFIAQGNIFGAPSRLIAGADVYYAELGVNRGAQQSDPPVHQYASGAALDRRSTPSRRSASPPTPTSRSARAGSRPG